MDTQPASGSVRALGPVNRLVVRRFDPIEVVLMVGCLGWLLPETQMSKALENGFWLLFNNLGVSRQMGAPLFYGLGFLLLICLLGQYMQLRARRMILAKTIGLADAVAICGVLYLVDFFLSTADPFDFERRWWTFFIVVPFFLAALYLDREQARRLIGLVAVSTGVQALYAIGYYAVGLYQFYTPHFGNRTGGTFHDPNALYPLCLIGAPLCLVWSRVQVRRGGRYLLMAASVANLAALVLTYMRSGWLALGVALVYLLCWRTLPGFTRPKVRLLGGALVVALLLGTLFLRTGGEMVGNAKDRSTRGRFAIWQVSLRVIAQHPLMGSGVATYEDMQAAQMTPALRAFHPLNSEPKSLLLHVAEEFGLVGCMAALFLIRQYLRFYRHSLRADPEDSALRAALIGLQAAVLALLTAGLTDTPILHQSRVGATFALALLLGATTVLAKEAEPSESVPTPAEGEGRRKLRIGIAVPLGALLLGLGWMVGSAVGMVRTALPRVEASVARWKGKGVSPAGAALPQSMCDAVVVAEDGNYYAHHGIDGEAMHRALRKDIRALRMVQGGSTITMQTARYLFLSEQKDLSRKLAELYLADYLEKRLTKRQILELYLSNVNFGMHTPGVLRAAQTFFNKSPGELTLGEVAFLAGNLPKPPDSPADASAKSVEVRRQSVLRRLQAYYPGLYSEAEVEKAIHERPVFAWQKQTASKGTP